MESRLERCSLKEAGISASGVQKFLDEIQTGGYHLHSLMLTRHGKVAYESVSYTHLTLPTNSRV